MEQQDSSYREGFNNGYLLAKYEPNLLATLLRQLAPSNDYLEGIVSGKDEYELEISRRQLDELTRLRNEAKDLDRDLEQL